jgi:hypothetical protein
LAAAVAFQSSLDNTCEIQVLQLSCEETMGLEVLSKPHVVYSIVESSRSLALASVLTDNPVRPFSFRYGMRGDNDAPVYKFFTTDMESATYSSRLGRLLQSDSVAEIYDLLSQGITPDQYSVFQPSQVALDLLQKALVLPMPEQRPEAVVRECCKHIEIEALSSNRGIQALLDAAETVAVWPTKSTMETSPSASDLSMVLSAVMETIERVAKQCPPNLTSQLQATQESLKSQLSVVKFVETELDERDFVALQLAARSMEELFGCLLSSSKFDAAVELWRLWQHKLTTEVLVESIVKLTEDVDPRGYATLMRDIVFPRLSINHELLPLLRAWTCRTADAFDEQQGDLDSAIFLLEVSACW